MTASSFTIALAPTSPTTLKLEPGHDGQFTFTVTCLATPDQVFDVILQALLIVAEDGKTQEADWLVTTPQQALIPGGKTETVTITVQPTATSPHGKHTIELAVSLKAHASDAYARSPAVSCEVGAPKPPDPPKLPDPPTLPDPPKPPDPPRPSHWKRPGWLIPINLLLGVWLFFSVFLLLPKNIPNTTSNVGSLINSLVVAVLINFASIVTWFVGVVRWVTTGLAAWLLVSQLMLRSTATGVVVDNVVVALAFITASLVSQRVGFRQTTSKP